MGKETFCLFFVLVVLIRFSCGKEDHTYKSVVLASSKDAIVPINSEMVEWTDFIFVMVRRQRDIVRKKFKGVYENKRTICFNIPDDYDYMDMDLLELFRIKVTPFLVKNDHDHGLNED